MFSFPTDAFPVAVQPSGEVTAAEMVPAPPGEREKKIVKDMTTMVLSRKPRTCNFLHWKDLKIVYKR